MKEPINVTRSFLPDHKEYCDEIRSIWDSHWLTNMGEKHQELEAKLKAYLETPNLTLYTNGHIALEAAIEALGLSGEIITTPFTFASTTHAIVRKGCTPVFCDIDGDNCTIDAKRIEERITSRTSAILPVHVYGNICDVEAIEVIAQKHGLKVIYDAAHAFGVTYKGKSSACFGDISMFSFHATKVFHTIEGGALSYHNVELKEKLNDVKNFGIRGPLDVEYVGGNAKMNEFQAAMGLCNLRYLSSEISKRGSIVAHYTERLSSIPGIRLLKPSSETEPNHAYFPVLFEDYKYSRDEVHSLLSSNGIISRKYFYPLTSSFACYAGLAGFDPEATPIAKRMGDSVLTLPLYSSLKKSDIDRICDVILGK